MNRLRPDARSLAVPAALCTLILVLIIATLLVSAIGWWLNLDLWPAMHDTARSYNDVDDLLLAMHHQYNGFYGLQAGTLAMLVVLVVLLMPTFIWWFQRAYRNLEWRQFHPAWAILGFLVPIVNIWKPKQLANCIWRVTVSRTLGTSIQWWWFGPWAMIGVNFFINLAARGAIEQENYTAVGVLLGAGVTVQATIAIAMLVMIRTVTRRQEDVIRAARAADPTE